VNIDDAPESESLDGGVQLEASGGAETARCGKAAGDPFRRCSGAIAASIFSERRG